tara:strand:- start:1134 stop:1793 length:660 start_codon:yes stop_codon:yes gene_type:complete
MSNLIVVKYSLSNNSSIPKKQYIQNNYSTVQNGMPQKTGFADGTSQFSQGRKYYIKSPKCNFYLQDKNNQNNCINTVRVEGYNKSLYDNYNKIIYTNSIFFNKDGNSINQWSTSNHHIHNKRRSQLGCDSSSASKCMINGKQNNIMSSQELISKRKNNAIGKGTAQQSNTNLIAFNDNNLNNAHTNFIAVKDAKRRTRNQGYVVPPKCQVYATSPKCFK